MPGKIRADSKHVFVNGFKRSPSTTTAVKAGVTLGRQLLEMDLPRPPARRVAAFLSSGAAHGGVAESVDAGRASVVSARFASR